MFRFKTVALSAFAAAVFFLSATPSQAAVRDVSSVPRIDERQEIQKLRIRQGLRSGQLTRQEAKNLIKIQKKIAQMERRFMRDGELSQKERQRLNHALDRSSLRIFKQKNDRDDRGDTLRQANNRW